MSSKPTKEGVEQVRALLDRMVVLERVIAEHERHVRELAVDREEYGKLRRQVAEQLGAMDLASSGNSGWEGRILWFIRELFEQSRRGA